MKAMKKIKIIIAIAILASTVSLFFNDCASAQSADKPTYIVSVLVTDRDGITPVSGAEVMFKSADVLVNIGITGADGKFHTQLPGGVYDVIAFYPGNSDRMKSTPPLRLELNKDSEASIALNSNP
jgi:hypothetical protein